MRNRFVSAMSALVLSIAPVSLALLTTTVLGGAAMLASSETVQAQDLNAADAAVEEAQRALDAAKASGEGVKEARQALKAAKAEKKRIQQEQKAARKEQKQNEAEAKAAERERQRNEAEAKAAEEERQRQEAEAKAAEEERQRREAEAKAAEQERQHQEAEAKAAEEQRQRQEAEAEEQKKKRKADAANAKRQTAAETPEMPKKIVEQTPEEADLGPGDTADTGDKKNKDKKKAKRKDRKKKQNTADSQQPNPSPDAPVAKPVADAPIEEQIEKALEKPAAVIPDDVTSAQRQRLKEAERQRRQEARKKRRQLLGAAGVAAAVGVVVPALGGKVVGDEGDRLVVERNGRYFVRKDESSLLRDNGRTVRIEQLRNGLTREIITRPNGSQIITVRDPGGYALRRVKVRPDGQRVVLFDYREDRQRQVVDYGRVLPPLRVTIPQDEYIVSGGSYTRSGLADVLMAPPVEQVTSDYTLREVRENDRLRSMVRRVDLDTITFDSGSATVRASQVPYLADMAGGMLDVIDENPAAVFLIEGHTDAVGSELYNLTLSDRRAETVARILVEAFDVPPENLVVEGYGEQYLKIDTLGDERRNRRVAIRNITPLLTASSE